MPFWIAGSGPGWFRDWKVWKVNLILFLKLKKVSIFGPGTSRFQFRYDQLGFANLATASLELVPWVLFPILGLHQVFPPRIPAPTPLMNRCRAFKTKATWKALAACWAAVPGWRTGTIEMVHRHVPPVQASHFVFFVYSKTMIMINTLLLYFIHFPSAYSDKLLISVSIVDMLIQWSPVMCIFADPNNSLSWTVPLYYCQ